MKSHTAIFGALLSATLGACGQSLLTAPTAQIMAAPQHNNIPATLEWDPSGPVVWLCATQPREYIAANGTRQMEEDHYISKNSCPTTPIK